MMYIHQVSSYYVHRDPSVDIKQECKKVASDYIRRTDRFIQMGILGVSNIKELSSDTALYLVSGQGDLSVFSRSCEQRYIDKTPPKPVDFINSLSNTAGFYISKYLGLDSANLNLSHQGFVVENAMKLSSAKLRLGYESQILLGGIDELPCETISPHHYLGLNDNIVIGEGANWLLLSQDKNNASAQVVHISEVMDDEGLKRYLNAVTDPCYVAISQRMDDISRSKIMEYEHLDLFEVACDFYETNMLHNIIQFVETRSGLLQLINCIDGKYCITVVKTH
ncbi:hypothetical protein [Vibrio ziniensis]|uniref:Beta-ketoacyl synthase N-terminal domain-containing protein n=1 Tax=Vibrio ziniensis TaxID=2711221 RepID=A0A6G7CJJ7_9VIBR|nr:hypothetical protein [Vibrio ziniensis]QIH42218.1 hypothetical protein G5S32_09515 [Vibrio ziniensis]